MGNQKYSIIPARAVYDPKLPHHVLRTLCAICVYSDQEGYCWPSQSTLARNIGVTRETINRHIRQLKSLGYIMVERRYKKDGGQTSNAMWVLHENSE